MKITVLFGVPAIEIPPLTGVSREAVSKEIVN
jgi:hypothetical protein